MADAPQAEPQGPPLGGFNVVAAMVVLLVCIGVLVGVCDTQVLARLLYVVLFLAMARRFGGVFGGVFVPRRFVVCVSFVVLLAYVGSQSKLITSLRTANVALGRDVATQEEGIALLRHEVGIYRDALAAETSKVDKQKEEILELKDELASTRWEAERDKALLKDKVDICRDALGAETSKADKQKEEILELKDELASTRWEAERDKALLKDKVDICRDALGAETSKVDIQKEEVLDLKDELASTRWEAERDKALLKDKVDICRDALGAETSKVNKQKEEILGLKDKLASTRWEAERDKALLRDELGICRDAPRDCRDALEVKDLVESEWFWCLAWCFMYIVVVERSVPERWQGVAYILLLIVSLVLGLALQVGKKPDVVITFSLIFSLLLVYLGGFLNRLLINRRVDVDPRRPRLDWAGR